MIEIKRYFRPDRGFENVEQLNGYIFSPEAQAHTFIISQLVLVDGVETPAEFQSTATVSCRFLKHNQVTELVEGSIESGKAVVTLPAECYAVPGRFTMTILLTKDSSVTCIYAATGSVLDADSENVNVSQNTVRDVDEKIAEINSASATAQAAVSQVQTAVAGVPAVIASIPQDYTALSNSVGDLKSAVGNTLGDFSVLSGTAGNSSRNINIDKTMALKAGDIVTIKVLNWSATLAERSQINVYVYDSSNNTTNIKKFDNLNLPSDYVTAIVPAGEYVKIRVSFQAVTGVYGKTATVVVGKIADGDASTVSATGSTTNIYVERSMELHSGDNIILKLLTWDQTIDKRASTMVYLYDSSSNATKIYDFDDLTVPSEYVNLIVPDGNYVKVRIAGKSTSGNTGGTISALIGKIDKTYVSAINGNNPLAGKIINCLGDSLTYGYALDGEETVRMIPGWVSQLTNQYGAITRNYGQTGSCITNTSDASAPMCTRYTNMDNNADFVIVFGGTNDLFGAKAALGDITDGDTGDPVNTTFYGAYNTLAKGLIDKYLARKTKIVLVVPPMRNRSDEANTNGMKLADMQDAVRNIAAKYSFPVIDLAKELGISAYTIANDSNHVYTYDGIHVTQDIVLSRMVPLIAGKLMEIV